MGVGYCMLFLAFYVCFCSRSTGEQKVAYLGRLKGVYIADLGL